MVLHLFYSLVFRVSLLFIALFFSVGRRCGGSVGVFLAGDEDFVDAGAVHVDDFEDEAVPLTFLSDFWDIAEVGGQKAAHGLVVVVVFVGELGDVEALFEVVDGAEAVDVPGVLVARGELDRVGLDVGHGVADDLLQDVVEGDEADDAAVLVEDHGLVDAGVAELGEHAEGLHRARYEHGLADVLREVERLALERGVEEVLGVEHAAEIVEVLAADGEDVLRMFADDAQVVAQGVGQVEPEHLGARRHQGVGGLVAHVEDAVDHGLLGFLEGAVLGALLDEVFDLVLGDGVLDVRVDAEQQEDAARRAGQEADEGAREARKPCDDAMVLHEHVLRVLCGLLLRQEFAEEQGDVRHDDDAEEHGNRRGMRQEGDEAGEVRRDEGAGADAHEDAGQRDADLDERERRFDVLEQAERRLGILVAVLGELLEASAVALSQGRLDQREKGVGQQQ